jgi:hypothetical protein
MQRQRVAIGVSQPRLKSQGCWFVSEPDRAKTNALWHFEDVSRPTTKSGYRTVNPLLVFVPVVLIASKVKPGSHTLLFVLSVFAIVPMTILLSHATESVAAKTGDSVGGLLNATLGNLAELVIAPWQPSAQVNTCS